MLTNGGGAIEHHRAKYFNNIVWGRDEGIAGEQLILCHTPLKDLVSQYADQFILVGGMGKVVDICHAYGYKNVVHVEEILAMCPQIMPLALKHYPQDRLA